MSALTARVLLGTWELVSFVVKADDGRPERHPFGRGARGRIVYTADGHMMAVLSAAPGGRSGSSTLETSHHASDAEKAAAYDRYLSYSGRWRIEGERIHHDVDLALVPGLVGQTWTRWAVYAPEPQPQLTLSYERRSRRGTVHRFVLTWRRPTPE